LLLGFAVLLPPIGYVISIGWRWNSPVNLDNLVAVALLGAAAVAVTVAAFYHKDVLLAFLMGPAWVVYSLIFWNDGTGPLEGFLHVVFLLVPYWVQR
jgi:hypothetical protein